MLNSKVLQNTPKVLFSFSIKPHEPINICASGMHSPILTNTPFSHRTLVIFLAGACIA